MAHPAPAKPQFKAAPDAPPMKVAAPAKAESGDEWRPIATAPEDPDARFWVRVTVLGKDGISMVPVFGTETLVAYRKTRTRKGGRWTQGLTIIDDRLRTKLGFRPSEWKPFDGG